MSIDLDVANVDDLLKEDKIDGTGTDDQPASDGKAEANGTGDGDGSAENADQDEFEKIKAELQVAEAESERLQQLQSEVEQQMNMTTSATANLSAEERLEIDSRSIWVGNVDYGATAAELEQHFHGCGSINRVTILCDKFTGHPKGFAYVEFAEPDNVQMAMALDDTLFRGRQIKVTAKRTNRPGISTTNRRPRGARRRGFGRGYYPRRAYSRRGYYSPY